MYSDAFWSKDAFIYDCTKRRLSQRCVQKLPAGKQHTHTHSLLSGGERSRLMATCFCFFTLSCPTLCDPMDRSPPGSSVQGISRQEGGMDGCSLFLGILPTQGSKLCLLDWQADSLALSHREAQEGTPSPESQRAYVGSSGLVLMPPIHQHCT